jgi:hypothetical protein
VGGSDEANLKFSCCPTLACSRRAASAGQRAGPRAEILDEAELLSFFEQTLELVGGF